MSNQREPTSTVLVPLMYGAEETEAVTIVDILRRAGIDVSIVSDSEIVACSRGVKILPERDFESIDDEDMFDAIVIPGGAEGVEHLSNEPLFEKILKRHALQGKLIGAICAAPLVLKQFGLLEPGMAITAHPSVQDQFDDVLVSDDDVVIDGNFVTSKGVGTALDFSLTLIEMLVDEKTSETVAQSIAYKRR